MKRLEMIKIIEKFLKNCDSKHEKPSQIDANKLLKRIEKAGMRPPGYRLDAGMHADIFFKWEDC